MLCGATRAIASQGTLGVEARRLRYTYARPSSSRTSMPRLWSASCRLFSAILLTALCAACALPTRAQIVRLPVPDTTSGNFFGVAVAISSDGARALIGASGEDACGVDSGAAFVYERDTLGAWHLAGDLRPADCAPGDLFGRVLSLSGDRAVVVGRAPEARDSRTIRGPDGEFLPPNSHVAYVFERDTAGVWNEVAQLRPTGGRQEGDFATSVSLDGDRVLVTTSGDVSFGQYHGTAYVFARRASGRWEREAILRGTGPLRSGIFGGNADLDGDRLAVAASTYFAERPGTVYLFERDAGGDWRETERLGGVDDFFIDLDLDGDRLLVGERKAGGDRSGVATLFARGPSGTWAETHTFTARRPYAFGAFGTAVALSGRFSLVVGFDEQLRQDFNVDRVVHVFGQDEAGAWGLRRVADVGATTFGASIDHNGRYAVVGQPAEGRPGAAYVLKLW